MPIESFELTVQAIAEQEVDIKGGNDPDACQKDPAKHAL